MQWTESNIINYFYHEVHSSKITSHTLRKNYSELYQPGDSCHATHHQCTSAYYFHWKKMHFPVLEYGMIPKGTSLPIQEKTIAFILCSFWEMHFILYQSLNYIMYLFFTSSFVSAHQEMFLKPGRGKHIGPTVQDLPSLVTLLYTHCVALATGGALWALTFLSGMRSLEEKILPALFQLEISVTTQSHIKYYRGSSELTFLSPQNSGFTGLRTEPLDVAVLDIPPGAQWDIEGSQSHKKSSWHFPGR